eukprot:COSAG06_NODE_40647_length_400_cov_0.594684_2_plen_33_part_01
MEAPQSSRTDGQWQEQAVEESAAMPYQDIVEGK